MFTVFVVVCVVTILGFLVFIVIRTQKLSQMTKIPFDTEILGQYPIDQDIERKLRLSRLSLLYQVKKNDLECRSVVFEGRQNINGSKTTVRIVTSVNSISGSEDYLIGTKELVSDKDVEFRFVPKNTSVLVDTYKSENDNFDNFQRLTIGDVVEFMKNKPSLIAKGDVIETSALVGVNKEDGSYYYVRDSDDRLILGELVIRRCQYL